MNEVKVSIILPVYNVEKYISKCLSSIVNQTLNEIEIIIVNDGSTDNSMLIAKKYSEQDMRIKIINKENGGLASARNAGMNQVNGKYVMHLDSDDFYEENMLEELYLSAEQYNSDIVVCGYYVEYVNEGYRVDNIVYSIDTDIKEEISEIIYYLNDKGMFNLVWNKLYKTEFVRKNKLKFPDFASTGQDLFFNIEAFKNLKRISMINKQLCHYMKYDGQTLVTKYHANMYDIAINRYIKTKELFEYYNMEDKKYVQWLINCYFNNLQNCILNLFRKDSRLTSKEKIRFIDEFILKDIYLTQNIMNYKNINCYGYIFKFSLFLNNAFLIYAIYSTLFFFKNKMTKLYGKVRIFLLRNA